MNISNKEKLSKLVDEHLKRTPTVTHVADKVRSRICGGRPYLSLHWRNKTGEQCQKDGPKWNDTICSLLLSSLINAMDQFATDLQNIMNNHHLTCIYVAYLSYSQEIINVLSKKILLIATAADIAFINSPDVIQIVEDEYMFSLLEQEICYREY